MLNFVAYLKLALEEQTFAKYISDTLAKELDGADGYAFGKPVWDFDYPESSIYITGNGFIGTAIAQTQPGDVAFAALGSTYPLALRPDGDKCRIGGYSYIHGAMNGECKDMEVRALDIC